MGVRRSATGHLVSGALVVGLSFLAACGGGGSPAPVIEETPVVVTPPVVVPITEALTIWNDTVTGTTADDVVTGARIDTVQVFNSGDSIVLGDGNDSLSATLNAGTVTPVAMTGVENVMFTVLGDATVDFDNVSGVTSIISLCSIRCRSAVDPTNTLLLVVPPCKALVLF